MQLLKIFTLASFVTMALFFTSCTDDNDETTRVSTTFELTDAPIDDPNVEAVVVTVAEVWIDGQEVEAFNKQTVDILALQNGKTSTLTNVELEEGTYNDVSLILDYNTDANGNGPGCYVLTTDGTKHILTRSTESVTINQNFQVDQENQNRFVLDMDLRKSITHANSGITDYAFVSGTDFSNSIRLVNKSEAGVISGNMDASLINEDKIVVYLYKKGQFNRTQETSGNIEFYNAVTSAAVATDGSYQLHFVEPGDYELHYASYQANGSGQLELRGTLLVNAMNAIDLNNLTVEANSVVNANVLVTGMLPL